MNCIAVVTGVCECFPGYEGKACQRSSCPNTCSGHGRCEYIENLGYAATAFDFADSQSAKFFKTYWGDNTQIGAVLGNNNGYVAGGGGYSPLRPK